MYGIARVINKWTVLILTILFWGLAFSAIKYSVQTLTPVELAGLRFFVADLFFMGTIFIGNFKLRLRDYPMVFILGLFGVTIYHVFLNLGEIYVTSGVASLLIATSPIFVLFLSRLFLSETITSRKLTGIVMAFLGVAVLSEPEFNVKAAGVIFVLLSSISASIYTVMGKRLMRRYNYAILTNYAIIFGSLPLMPFVPSALSRLVTTGDVILGFSVVFLGIFSTYLGYLGWYYFLEREEASRASVFLLAIPLVAIIAGVILLGETIDIMTLLGGIAIIGGIALVLRG